MRNIFWVLIVSLIFISCKNNAYVHEHDEVVETVEIEKYKSTWKVLGTEPFWNIYINGDTALYMRLNENIDSVYFKIHHYSDRDSIVEMHVMDAAMNEGDLIIRKESCSDGMSDKQYAYSAQFSFRNEVLKGCALKK